MPSPEKNGGAASPSEHNGQFRIRIGDEAFNFREVDLPDKKITGAQVGEAAGVHPLSEYVILQLLKNGELETLRPTELADLGEKGIETFFVIKGSETYRFQVDGLSLEWPRTAILSEHVKQLVGASLDDILVLDLPQGDRVIPNGSPVNLSSAGVEMLKIRKKPEFVTVIYNQEHEFKLEPRVYTTEELMKKFEVPAGYKLDILTPEGLRELKPGEKVMPVDGMEFASHPPVGQSS